MNKLVFFALFCFLGFGAVAQMPKILVPFRDGKKWGYSDTLGRVQVKPIYDTVSSFDYNGISRNDHVLATAKWNGKPMVIDDRGAVLVPPKYDHVLPIITLEDFAFVVSKNNKYGVFTRGKELFPPIYDFMESESGGQFKVHQNGKYGLINAEGKLVIPVTFDMLQQRQRNQEGLVEWEGIQFGKEPALFKIKAANEYGSGERLPGILTLSEDMQQEDWHTRIEALKNEYNVDSILARKHSGFVYKGGRQGILLPAEEGKVFFFSKPYTLHYVKYFSTGSRKHLRTKAAAYIVASFNDKYGIITEAEETVLPFEYDSIEEKEGFFLLKKNGKVGFFIWNTVYPVIQPAFDEYVSKELLPIKSNWNFTLFKVIKAGKSGFVGENGVAYFRN